MYSMKHKSFLYLLLPPAAHLVLMLLLSTWTQDSTYTYATLAIIALAITIPLTVLLLFHISRHHPKVFPFLPLSFAMVIVVLHLGMLWCLETRSYECLPYEWGKYPRIIHTAYTYPFALYTFVVWISGCFRKLKQAEAEPADYPVFVTLWVNRVLLGVGATMLFVMPALMRWYNTVRILNPLENTAILSGFYACAPFALWALWNVERLLSNIQKGAVFVTANVTLLRRIRLCCGAVTLLCIWPSYYYPPLLFLIVIMGFLTLMVNVVCQVMKAAVAIREENDLTV